ncbi:MAG: hypothetical protein LBD23_19015 [Oscillospiraceae bacterium]|jgi:amino acid permease|nr:hypothetical protein [Oscillospiraceae bacterium]
MDTILGLLDEFQTMYNILYFIVPIVIFFILIAMERNAAKVEKDMDKNHFVVHQGKITAWIGIICTIIFGVFLALSFIYPEEWWHSVVFSAFLLLGVYLAISSIIWEIKVDGNEVRYRSLFMKTKVFSFDSINNVKMREHHAYNAKKLIMYSGTEKLFYVESHCIGYSYFVARLEEKGLEFVATDEFYGL